MITTDTQAAWVLVQHILKGKTGHPSAVRRYCKRGLDLQNAEQYYSYLTHKEALSNAAGRLISSVKIANVEVEGHKITFTLHASKPVIYYENT